MDSVLIALLAIVSLVLVVAGGACLVVWLIFRKGE